MQAAISKESGKVVYQCSDGGLVPDLGVAHEIVHVPESLRDVFELATPDPRPGLSDEQRLQLQLFGLVRGAGLMTAPTDLDGWTELACAAIDRQAGALRETIGTPGYGQLTEYDRTLEDARAFLETVGADPATDPAGYPMVQAEIDALAAASGEAPDPAAVAQEIIDLAAAWHAAIAAIKRVRRLAKMRIQAAAGVEEIADILAGVEWPEVEGVVPE
ncbi:hypothetical protein DPQ33_16440 [Oceanidesulfovibrio indonesiensis]|uniref:Uncharacterized protein n=1 Tax=Oceanidesulfovibrio indonesiensis TaxID=54767 RepID=A0A7M3MB04_9BACT|nr:hypothetical protein [Oceanidesulfovibrio indonesiensis]TVM15075.1 hypothetical protein DPQ33_16440 [Oceanidesulfovibrio indonesiensis]